jgi:hypothetical protein
MNWVAFFSKAQALRDAVASVALSHAESCTCEVCRAAHGDEEAFARLLARRYLEEGR